MRKLASFTVVSCLAVALTGCNNDSDLPEVTPPPPPPSFADVRVIHAAPDAPLVNVYANDQVLGGLENVDYQVASGLIEVQPNTYDVRVEAIVPGGNVDVISASLTLEADMVYNVFAIDTVADGVEPLLVANADTAVSAGNARVQVVHAAPNAPTVDIYVTAPDDDLMAAQPTATASFKDFTGQLEVPAGDYRIRITAAGMTDVLYDSGTVNLADGADLVVAATQSVAAGDAPVTLLAIGENGATPLLDANSGAELRVVHGIADAPPVDVIANDSVTLFNGPGFLEYSDYINVAADSYTIDVVATADNSVVAIDDAPVTLDAGMFYTAIANNTLASPDLDLLVDMPRSVATESRVRIIHASQAAGPVDIYVTADGDISAVEPAFAEVPYNTGTLAETGYVSLAPGDYVVSVTAPGSKDAVIETPVLTLAAGGIYTAIAVDGMDSNPPQLITLDDLAAPEAMFMTSSTFNISLSPSQEVPAVEAMTMASAVVEIDTSKGAFRVELDASELTNVVGAHVHDGMLGMNGPVAFGLTDNGDGTFSLAETKITQGMEDALLAGNWYLNVHTEANPSGEVRGQIVPDTMAVVTFPISGAQSNPPVTTDASGSGYALFDTTNNSVMLTTWSTGVDDATMAHIHSGYAGTNGGVVVSLMQDSENLGVWKTDGFVDLDSATANQLLSGGHYVNIHTPANPSGEIRGQITPDNIEVYGVSIDGSQEVPAVTTMASGYGAITLNTDTGLIVGTLTVEGLTPTMAHIHEGAVGVNGGVVVALDNPETGVWTVPTNTVLDSMMIQTMQSGGYYTNFHTVANPSGEIRGQITKGF